MNSEVALEMDAPEVIIRVMLTSFRAIDDYLGDCRRLGWSGRSIATYRRTLDEFADRLPVDLDVTKIAEDDIRRYLATKAHLAPGTVAGHEAHLSSWLKWLYCERKIARNPMDRIRRTRRIPAEDLDVVSISVADVPRLLAESKRGTAAERNAMHITAYLGPRRRAVANLRREDYDREAGMIRFREKGDKTIWKPVPDELAVVLDRSIDGGDVLSAPHDYLVPPEGCLVRAGLRDDRVVWRVIKRVADRAGVKAHVHALRAAFACFYLERNPDDLMGLKELLGHRSLQTTLIYLRRHDKASAMERVRSLSWAVDDTAQISLFAGFTLASSPVVGAGGFEPPFPVISMRERVGDQHAVDDA